MGIYVNTLHVSNHFNICNILTKCAKGEAPEIQNELEYLLKQCPITYEFV